MVLSCCRRILTSVMDRYYWKHKTSNFFWCKVFDVCALLGQNLMSKLKLWVLIIACKWDVRFLMYVLGAACCQQIQKHPIWRSVLSVISVPDVDFTHSQLDSGCSSVQLHYSCLSVISFPHHGWHGQSNNRFLWFDEVPFSILSYTFLGALQPKINGSNFSVEIRTWGFEHMLYWEHWRFPVQCFLIKVPASIDNTIQRSGDWSR